MIQEEFPTVGFEFEKIRDETATGNFDLFVEDEMKVRFFLARSLDNGAQRMRTLPNHTTSLARSFSAVPTQQGERVVLIRRLSQRRTSCGSCYCLRCHSRASRRVPRNGTGSRVAREEGAFSSGKGGGCGCAGEGDGGGAGSRDHRLRSLLKVLSQHRTSRARVGAEAAQS